MIDLTPVAQAAVVLMGALITTFLVPYIKSKTTADQQKQAQKWTGVAVSAAEQMFGSKEGQEKKAHVYKFLESKGLHLDLATVDYLIEAAVNELNRSQRFKDDLLEEEYPNGYQAKDQ